MDPIEQQHGIVVKSLIFQTPNENASKSFEEREAQVQIEMQKSYGTEYKYNFSVCCDKCGNRFYEDGGYYTTTCQNCNQTWDYCNSHDLSNIVHPCCESKITQTS